MLFPIVAFWVFWTYVLNSMLGTQLALLGLLVAYTIKYAYVPEIEDPSARWGARVSFVVAGLVGGVMLLIAAFLHITLSLIEQAEGPPGRGLGEAEIELIRTVSTAFQPVQELVLILGAGIPEEVSFRGLNLILIITLWVYLEVCTLIVRPWQWIDGWMNRR